MSLDKLPINAFDCVVLAVLAFGLMRGRKHGMSEELVGLITWLAVLIGCAFWTVRILFGHGFGRG